MLTQEIKQKIDSARDILVGKIPTPTGQVEQITLALVYKFMNDIDEQNVELGGSHKFFTGEYAKYAWKHLLDKSLSAYERVTLYGEGLDKMHLNPNLPQFFRNVFRRAFLPFRDPDVLTLFLKEIDGFKYGHNGELGDAFEYLLQVMGTQGDAGQFLTPRHIINFIVSIVDPQKTDKILDPAVGTAGFLISAYQHILRMNTKRGSSLPGSGLTTDERKKFANNFIGYDVSHDLVRLSLVNMYLHDFPDPKINEYDTLTSMDKWDDDFDCILTNPPFMTPKGGIRPHKRFSIQAKRSEVLFVDYIMEHLNPNGKAGIIVPEGIIFQSANAYKNLRKMMVDQNYLYAVVSLPAGVFNPYAGVKTSILLIDKVLAKKTDSILFVKVENDGFDLGAQRRPIEKDDLPRAVEIMKRYKICIQTGKQFKMSDDDKKIVSMVSIEKISKSGDYNLSGDRYKESITLVNRKWPLIELNKICEKITDGTHQTPTYADSGIIFLSSKNVKSKNIDWDDIKYITPELHLELSKRVSPKLNDILLAKNGTTGVAAIVDRDIVFDIYVSLALLRPSNLILNRYLLHFINSDIVKKQFNSRLQGIGVPNLHLKEIKEVLIPLPPLEFQQEIVSQLDRYQKIIDGAKQVVDNYRPEIEIDPDWEIVELGDIATMSSGGTPSKSVNKYWDGDIPWVSPKDMKVDFIEDTEDHVSLEAIKNSSTKLVDKDTILCVVRSGILQHSFPVAITLRRMCFNQDIMAISVQNSHVVTRYLFYILKVHSKEILELGIKPGVTVQSFQSGFFKKYKIPLPPLDIQKQIVSKIEEEQQVVDVNKRLIEIYERKMKQKIDGVWGYQSSKN